jgi:hypothetical protein
VDFESTASTNFTTPARMMLQAHIIPSQNFVSSLSPVQM